MIELEMEELCGRVLCSIRKKERTKNCFQNKNVVLLDNDDDDDDDDDGFVRQKSSL